MSCVVPSGMTSCAFTPPVLKRSTCRKASSRCSFAHSIKSSGVFTVRTPLRRRHRSTASNYASCGRLWATAEWPRWEGKWTVRYWEGRCVSGRRLTLLPFFCRKDRISGMAGFGGFAERQLYDRKWNKADKPLSPLADHWEDIF